MGYLINPAAFSGVFTVPTAVADNHLKLARGEHIKVLLYIMRNLSVKIDATDIAKATDVSEYDVKEALLYWADAGILLPENTNAVAETKTKEKTLKRQQKPDRADVARRGAEDEKIRYLLREAQMKLGRNLKSNEASTLVWLYDDEGLEVSLILMIIQYAVTHGKANMRFIESVAVDWIDKGINSLALADEELKKIAVGEQAWSVVCSAFGIERRKPSKKETELSILWVEEWKISKEMLLAAYEACVDSKSKFTFSYTAKIIETWHNKGYKSVADIEKKTSQKQADSYAAYDIDLFEKMLNTKD